MYACIYLRDILLICMVAIFPRKADHSKYGTCYMHICYSYIVPSIIRNRFV